MQNDDDQPNEADGSPQEPAGPGADQEGGEVLAFPGLGVESADLGDQESADLGDEEDADVGLGEGGEESEFDSFTHEHYVASTTREYRGLAEAIERSAREEHEQQAVAASMPGVQTGVVGFEDVTGEETPDMEAMHQEERAQRSDLYLRIGTALGLVAVLFGALLAGGGWIALLLALIIILALGEFYSSVRRSGFVPVALFGLLGTIGLLIGTWRSGPFAIAGFIGATMVAVTIWYSLVPRREPLANASITILGVAWIAGLLAFAYPIFQSGDMVNLVLVLVVLTALFDVASFFVGKTMGRTQLAPVLSPHKTVEGLVAGVVLTIAAGAGIGAAAIAEPFTLQSGIALGVAVSVFAPLGDLAESTIKRLLGVKDMGSILPGHGGMLDRVDGFIFSVPAAYLVYLWFGWL